MVKGNVQRKPLAKKDSAISRGVPLWILELALVFLPERLPFGPGCQGS